ncbi:MAG: hypothetical protein GY898_12160 [Proteobacteria bacterium]|nr:hypothetical protein [Pseudomonadota bacterium]
MQRAAGLQEVAPGQECGGLPRGQRLAVDEEVGVVGDERRAAQADDPLQRLQVDRLGAGG